MSKPIRVPDPVYERLDSEADERDVPKMVIVGEWMDAYDRLQQIENEFIEAMQTRGGGDE